LEGITLKIFFFIPQLSIKIKFSWYDSNALIKTTFFIKKIK